MSKILSPGSKVYIDKWNHTYEAIFTGNTLKHGDLLFGSPSAFSRYVTDQYNSRVQHPSGWEAIYTLNEETRETKTIKRLYDDGVKNL
jgi:hypothetical protein